MELNANRYRLPFKEPFTTGAGSITEREGIILTLRENDILAFGEAAPLPGYSPETLQEVIDCLRQNGRKLKDGISKRLSDDETEFAFDISAFPSLEFALDTLIADFKAKTNKQTMQEFLFQDFPKRIPVNATIPADETASAIKKAGEYWDAGYRTFKLKTGKKFERELEIITQLRNCYPSSKIRIDANQNWSLADAIANLNRLHKFDIEYCEEPVQNPTLAKLRTLKEESKIAIALDESLHGNPRTDEWIKEGAGSVIIIKPMVYGNFRKNFETSRLAVTHDYTTVFTSTLESGIGIMMTAILASGLGSPHFAHGLSTGSLLKMDVWHDRAYISSGYLILPDGYGLDKKRGPEIQDIALQPLDI